MNSAINTSSDSTQRQHLLVCACTVCRRSPQWRVVSNNLAGRLAAWHQSKVL